MMLSRSLLLLLASALLLFLSTSASNISRLEQLLDGALLVLSVLNLHGLPHLLDFVRSLRLRLFLHAFLLHGCLLVQVVLRQFSVFVTHGLALTPLTQSVLVVDRLVTPQQVLNGPHLHVLKVRATIN